MKQVGSEQKAATVTVGAVTTLAPGAQATVKNTGTPAAAVLEFGIPRGADGTGGTGGSGSAGAVALSDTQTITAQIGQHAFGSAGTNTSWGFLFRAESPFRFSSLRQSLYGSASSTVRVVVYESDAYATKGTALASSGAVAQDGQVRVQTFTLNTPVRAEQGGHYLVFFESTGNMSPGQDTSGRFSNPPTNGRMTFLGGRWDDFLSLYSQGNSWFLMGFELLDGLPKTVTGPLDPTDFPRSTVAAAVNNSGFMVVDDAAKTAALYWKFSDGSTKKLDLT